MKLSELPEEERPREKALKFGLSSLSDAEVLALLIGKGAKGHSALELSYKLLADRGNLRSLSEITLPELTSYPGIKGAKGLGILAIFEVAKRISAPRGKANMYSPAYLHEYLKRVPLMQESAYVFALDGRGKIRAEKKVAEGSSDKINIAPKDVIMAVMRLGYPRFVFVHTHSSGVASPSAEDIAFTDGLLEEASSLSLRLYDHLIHAADGYYSFAENGLL